MLLYSLGRLFRFCRQLNAADTGRLGALALRGRKGEGPIQLYTERLSPVQGSAVSHLDYLRVFQVRDFSTGGPIPRQPPDGVGYRLPCAISIPFPR